MLAVGEDWLSGRRAPIVVEAVVPLGADGDDVPGHVEELVPGGADENGAGGPRYAAHEIRIRADRARVGGAVIGASDVAEDEGVRADVRRPDAEADERSSRRGPGAAVVHVTLRNRAGVEGDAVDAVLRGKIRKRESSGSEQAAQKTEDTPLR